MNNQLIYNDVPALCEGFTSFFHELVDGKEGSFNVALSGGNTPVALFKYWSHHLANDKIWKKINFFWVDERCVKPNSAESNYFNAKVNLFDNLLINNNNIFRIKGEEPPELEATRYALTVQNQVPIKNNYPGFDLIMLGMGDDGHTASIFPNQIDLWGARQYYVVAQHPETGQRRVSMTGGVINNAEYVAFIVTGKNKSEKVSLVMEDNGSDIHRKLPAGQVKPKSGNLFWFLDHEAASLMPHE